ncbi:hypothetical protein SRHO_G00120200 [Serrasalmus rhombeus]
MHQCASASCCPAALYDSRTETLDATQRSVKEDTCFHFDCCGNRVEGKCPRLSSAQTNNLQSVKVGRGASTRSIPTQLHTEVAFVPLAGCGMLRLMGISQRGATFQSARPQHTCRAPGVSRVRHAPLGTTHPQNPAPNPRKH